MIGFCPEGPDCEYEHPKFELPVAESGQSIIQCHFCGKYGHKSNICPENPNAIPESERNHNFDSKPRHNVRDPGARDAAMRYQQQQVRQGLFKPNGLAGPGAENKDQGAVQNIHNANVDGGPTQMKRMDVDIRDDEQRIMDGMGGSEYSVAVDGELPEKRMRMDPNFVNVKTGYRPGAPKAGQIPQSGPAEIQQNQDAQSQSSENTNSEVPQQIPSQQQSQPPPQPQQQQQHRPHPHFSSRGGRGGHGAGAFGINRPGYLGVRDRVQGVMNTNVPYRPGVPRNMADVKCFKCGEFGHVANNCTAHNPNWVNRK